MSTTPLFNQKFAIFKQKVLAMFELPDEAWPGMEQALISAGFNQVEIKTVTTSAPVAATTTSVVSSVSTGKFLTGYNVYVKESKTSGKDFKVCGSDWKSMTKEQQNVYNLKANEANQACGATNKNKGKGKAKNLSGWNVYMKENNKTVKSANPGMSSQDVLKKLGSDWKALGKEGQEPWNTKAKATVAV